MHFWPHLGKAKMCLRDVCSFAFFNCIIFSTGWSKSKVATLNGCNSGIMHFWPYVGKAKMGLEVALFLKHCNQTAENVNKFSKIERKCHLSNPFWLYQHRVRNAYFQSYSHLNLQLLIWVTLYLHFFKSTYTITFMIMNSQL